MIMVSAALTLAAATAAAPGTSAAPSANATPVGQRVSAREQLQTIKYWTPRRMRTAKAYPTPKLRGRARLTADAATPGRERAFEAVGARQVAGSARVVQEAPLPAAYSYPYPFTRYYVEGPLYGVHPYRTIGKMYFVQNGGNYVCSASSVVGSPRQIVFTAGHCMHDGGAVTPGNASDGWSSSILFRPAFRSGSAPYGTFAADSRWALSGWTLNGYFTQDMGAFSVGSPRVSGIGDGADTAGGLSLRSRVGALGFIINAGRNRHWDAFGYPAASPFAGQLMTKCESNAAGFDQNASLGPGVDPTGIGCDMTGGSSGGPWILGLGSANYLNGVNSYKYNSQPLAMFGPYFTNNAQALRCAAATGNGSATSC
jgi:hypothetical protein